MNWSAPITWRWTLGCILFMALLQINAASWFYQRDDIVQLWRLWTAHWVHVGWIHWGLNAVALMCLPAILPLSRLWFIVALFTLAPFISVMLYVFEPSVASYAGLSGVLHGLYVIAALQNLSWERLFAGLVLGIIALKLGYEAIFGDMGTAALIGRPVLTAAHVWGVVGAVGLWYMKPFTIMQCAVHSR